MTLKTAGRAHDVDPQRLRQALTANPVSPTVVYHCSLITPMFGGGVVTKTVEKQMPIRATAIRGQLRYWWRLLARRHAADRTTAALFSEEREIWGGLGDAETLRKSKVRVSVRMTKAPSLTPAAMYPPGKRNPKFGPFEAVKYALFSAQGKANKERVEELPAQLAMPNLTFELCLARLDGLTEDQWQSVLNAVRWWANFGGVGARVRRGLGAVHVRDGQGQSLPVPDGAELAAAGCRLVVQSATDTDTATRAWERAIGALAGFRQGVKIGRNPRSERENNKSPAGQSLWPEADAIRRITRRHSDDHKPKHPAGDVFPRAAFGLPIITHFNNRKDATGREPQDVELLPIPAGAGQAATRMASPLILRPMLIERRWTPGALLLPNEHAVSMGLLLRDSETKRPLKELSGKQWQVKDSNLVPPLKDRSTDALLAFLDFFAASDAGPATSAPEARQAPSEVIARPRLRFNAAKRLMVTPRVGREFLLTEQDTLFCLSLLSNDAKQRLQQNRLFDRVELTVDGTRLVSVQELGP